MYSKGFYIDSHVNNDKVNQKRRKKSRKSGIVVEKERNKYNMKIKNKS